MPYVNIKITREGTPAASVWLDEILERYCAGASALARNGHFTLDNSMAVHMMHNHALAHRDGDLAGEAGFPVN